MTRNIIGENKNLIAAAGGIPRLVLLAGSTLMAVRIEAIAALANLAVNDHNEIEIVRYHGLEPIVNGLVVSSDGLNHHHNKSEKELQLLEELATQCSRSIRNLSVNRKLTYSRNLSHCRNLSVVILYRCK